MKLTMRTDYCGNDIDRISEYSSKLEINEVWSLPTVEALYSKEGLMISDKLSEYKREFEDKDLNLVMITEVINDDNVKSSETADKKADSLCSVIESMGKAGIESLFLFLDVHLSEDDAKNKINWEYLFQIYRKIVPAAEKSRIMIANHGHQWENYLVYSSADLRKLIETVPSDYNGITFCVGCLTLAGDNIYEEIKKFGKKIFSVHARDVLPVKDTFDEVLLGRGDVDMVRILKILKEIGYDGNISPEHLPRISYETNEEIVTAWGFINAGKLTMSNSKYRMTYLELLLHNTLNKILNALADIFPSPAI